MYSLIASIYYSVAFMLGFNTIQILLIFRLEKTSVCTSCFCLWFIYLLFLI